MKGQTGIQPVRGEGLPDDADGGHVDFGEIGGAGEGDGFEDDREFPVGAEPGNEEFRSATG